MGSRNTNPIEAIPGEDVFGNVVNPGDNIASATKSGGSAYINKGRYLGQRKPMNAYRQEDRCYVVEYDLINRRRTNAAGEEWEWIGWGNDPLELKQKQELESAIGAPPARPTRNRWDPAIRFDEKLRAEVQAEHDAYDVARQEYDKKKEAWLDANYPYKSTPYVRRSTLWLNKIIKL